MNAIVWIILSFFAGAVPFSPLIGRMAVRRDIRTVGDGNPGATNVLHTAGKVWGTLALLLDMLKGAIPVAIAYHIVELHGLAMVITALAPVLGHAISPFLRFRGGKAVAVSGGIWGGLTAGQVPVVGGLFLIVGKLLLDSDSWAVMLMMLGAFLYLIILHQDSLLLTIWLGNLLVLITTHRHDLRTPPHFKTTSHTE